MHDTCTLHVHVEGCSPYGFRLAGGNGQPVLITKLRPKSKGAAGGLLNGDIVLAINGHNCNDVSYERLTSLVEHSGHSLDLNIMRIKQTSANYKESVSRDTLLESHDWLDSIFSNNVEYNDLMSSSRSAIFTSPTPPPVPPLPRDTGGSCNQRGFSPRSAGRVHPYNIPTGAGPLTQQELRSPKELLSNERRPSVVNCSNQQGVDVTWNPRNKLVTMSLDLLATAPLATAPPERHRSESFILINSPPPPTEKHRTQHTWQLTTPQTQQPIYQATVTSWQSSPYPPHLPAADLPPDVLKIITPSSTANGNIAPPAQLGNKKLFADSSFYDDPSHNYPTVEQQIKMAHQVAHSLTAPANRSARGYEMFMKRRAKSGEWTAAGNDTDADMPLLPTPPRIATTAAQYYFNTPYIPTTVTDEQANAMSSDEYERVRLFDENSTIQTAAPQVCFSIAQNLRELNDKGARMFAKRRAKVDKWTLENTRPDSDAMQRIVSQAATNNIVSSAGSAGSGGSSMLANSCRLGDVLNVQNAARMTPWDAVITYGNVEPAFEHLNKVNLSQHHKQQNSRSETVC